jgi:hypothetical protein
MLAAGQRDPRGIRPPPQVTDSYIFSHFICGNTTINRIFLRGCFKVALVPSQRGRVRTQSVDSVAVAILLQRLCLRPLMRNRVTAAMLPPRRYSLPTGDPDTDGTRASSPPLSLPPSASRVAGRRIIFYGEGLMLECPMTSAKGGVGRSRRRAGPCAHPRRGQTVTEHLQRRSPKKS